MLVSQPSEAHPAACDDGSRSRQTSHSAARGAKTRTGGETDPAPCAAGHSPGKTHRSAPSPDRKADPPPRAASRGTSPAPAAGSRPGQTCSPGDSADSADERRKADTDPRARYQRLSSD